MIFCGPLFLKLWRGDSSISSPVADHLLVPGTVCKESAIKVAWGEVEMKGLVNESATQVVMGGVEAGIFDLFIYFFAMLGLKPRSFMCNAALALLMSHIPSSGDGNGYSCVCCTWNLGYLKTDIPESLLYHVLAV